MWKARDKVILKWD